jgi:hypothetical protein
MDEAVRQVHLMSDGAVTRMTFAQARSADVAHTPTSDLATIIDIMDGLGSRFTSSKTHRGRLDLIKEAQDLVVEWKYSDQSKVMSSEERNRAIASDTRTVDDIAIYYGINRRTVQRIRKNLGVARLVGAPRKNATPVANGNNTT